MFTDIICLLDNKITKYTVTLDNYIFLKIKLFIRICFSFIAHFGIGTGSKHCQVKKSPMALRFIRIKCNRKDIWRKKAFEV